MSVRKLPLICAYICFSFTFISASSSALISHLSYPVFLSFSQLFHLMRCELKRREVCNTWRLELSFMRLGCCPAPFLAGVAFYVPMQMAH